MSCTENFTCPKENKNIIIEKKKCINKCKNDDIYKYEYNNTCYKQCPNGTYYKDNLICYDNNESKESVR